MMPFALRLVNWQRTYGRHDLPWQNTCDPYHIWISEIMLQQTQVATVMGYYQKFMERFPSVQILADATEEEVLRYWAGLGYYSRARNLHHAAKQIMQDYGGDFPRTAEVLIELKGIGRSTAAAISSFCFGERAAILDGNVKRVLARHAGIAGFTGDRQIESRLWEEANHRLPEIASDMPSYTQGMMDVGAALCTRTRPMCEACPLSEDCVAFKTGQTALLPTPKPTKKIPSRALNIVLVIADEEILLEHRQQNAVWKGLWSLPEIAVEVDEPEAIKTMLQQWGMVAKNLEKRQAFRHTFSHYHLELTPWLIYVDKPLPLLSKVPAYYAWKRLDQLDHIGLPAPITRYLNELGASHHFKDDQK